MTTYVALFRGINVGGKNILPMHDLRRLLTGLGCEDVRTYIQSGNAVFRHPDTAPDLAGRIRGAILAGQGFEPRVLVLTVDGLEHAVRANPFPEGEADPSKLHLFFLAAAPDAPDLEAVEAVRAASERFELVDSVAYLHAPEGIGSSKLASRVEKAMGVAATARNWRSVNKILDMARELD